ncbi:MAG: ASCH domain-containing protein [Pyrinomonadaceae bacterium]
MNDMVEKYWREFLANDPSISPDTPYQVWYFGDVAEMAHELAELVIAGVKTATASLLETNKREPEKAPIDGGYSVVTSFDGEPMCVIQTTEIRHLPFHAVDAKFAYDEGEGDRSLRYWRDVHISYYTREAAKLGFDFDENSIVCCERFRLVYPL